MSKAYLLAVKGEYYLTDKNTPGHYGTQKINERDKRTDGMDYTIEDDEDLEDVENDKKGYTIRKRKSF